jgi:RimJ/RimL family protein N-acetyltransferase
MTLDFTSQIELENDRVLLRPLVQNDFDVLLDFSLNEPELWTHSLIPANGAENLKTYIELALDDKKNKRAFPFLVLDKTTKKVAGSTRFYDYQAYHNTVQLGFTWYGKEFQGTGLNKNCKYLLLEYAFNHLGLDRVEFRADNNNKKSIGTMKSIGCTEEGVLRSNCASRAGRRNSIVLSILKHEWDEKIGAELKAKIEDN